MFDNSQLLVMAKEITIANLSSASESAEVVADFMEAIYNKLIELNKD